MANKFFENFSDITYTLPDGKTIFVKDFFKKAKIEREALDKIVNYTYAELQEGDRPDILSTRLYGDPDLYWTFFLVNDFDNHNNWYKSSSEFFTFINEKYPGKYYIAENATDVCNSTSKFLVGEQLAKKFSFTADANQTIFTGADDNGFTLSFDETFSVYRNGVKQVQSENYTVGGLTNGKYTTVTFLPGGDLADQMQAGDVLDVLDHRTAFLIQVDPTHKRIATIEDGFTAGETIAGLKSLHSMEIHSIIEMRDGVAHYVNSDGIKKNTDGDGWTAVTFFDHELEHNEEKRKIKVIEPGLVDSVVREFEKVMSS